ncbi:beta-carotene ketolase [Calothrix sp. HK-06]|nr:beta-carotene ketolase [Calothrix sp. HK-06]
MGYTKYLAHLQNNVNIFTLVLNNYRTSMLQKSIVYPSQIPLENSIHPYRGITTAIAIMGIWAVSLILLMNVNVQETNIIALVAGVLCQTFCYTGLFITAHDAMHGAVNSHNIKLNHSIGSLCLFLYGALSYKTLLKKHWQHHQHPGTENDPDFHDGKHQNMIAWYFHFMKGYWSWKQIIIITIVYNSLAYVAHVPQINLILFWVTPSLLSSLQLFYFGTFEPHSQPITGYTDSSHTRTISRPAWLSFLTCYHFGYHKEHHQYPNVPWWQLSKVHQQTDLLQLLDVDKDKQEVQTTAPVQ